MHPHITGHRSRLPLLARLIGHMKAKGGCWFATHAQVAQVVQGARGVSALDHAFNIADLRRLARRRLPRGIFEFIDRGTEDEVSLRDNRAAFDRIKLRPRVAVDVSNRTTEATILGRTHTMPLAVAPRVPPA